MGASVSCDTPVPLQPLLNSRTQYDHPTRYSLSNRVVITDILEQDHPRWTSIPVIRYCSCVWSGVVSVQSRIHRVLDGCRSDSLQRCYYSRVRSGICKNIRKRLHCISCWSWAYSSCRDQPEVDTERLEMDCSRRPGNAIGSITLIRFLSL